MKKLTIWDKTSNIITANGTDRTASEIFERFPFTKYDTTVLERNGNSPLTMAIDSIEVLKTVHGVTAESDTEALAELEIIVNS